MMRKITKKLKQCILIGLVFLLVQNALSQGSWVRRADYAGNPRSFAVGFSVQGKGYIGSGGNGFSLSKDFWAYDTLTYAWSPIDSLPVPTNDGIAFYANGKGYVGSGWGAIKQFWEYNSLNDTWSSIANFPGVGKEDQTGFTINGKIYIGTGWTGTSPTNEFWEYDPIINSWTQKANVPGPPRNYAASFSLLGKGYIGTGSSNLGPLNDFWEYDPQLDVWNAKANFPGGARYYASSFTIDSYGYIGTGRNSIDFNDFWKYDPYINTWISIPNMPTVGRNKAVGLTIGNRGFIGTGRVGITSPLLLNDFWEYLPESLTDVKELNKTPELKFFPNPFVLKTVLYSTTSLNNATLTVYNSLGKFERQIGNIFGQTITFQRENLSNGIYFFQLTQENKIISTFKLEIID